MTLLVIALITYAFLIEDSASPFVFWGLLALALGLWARSLWKTLREIRQRLRDRSRSRS